MAFSIYKSELFFLLSYLLNTHEADKGTQRIVTIPVHYTVLEHVSAIQLKMFWYLQSNRYIFLHHGLAEISL